MHPMMMMMMMHPMRWSSGLQSHAAVPVAAESFTEVWGSFGRVAAAPSSPFSFSLLSLSGLSFPRSLSFFLSFRGSSCRWTSGLRCGRLSGWLTCNLPQACNTKCLTGTVFHTAEYHQMSEGTSRPSQASKHNCTWPCPRCHLEIESQPLPSCRTLDSMS